MQLSGKESAHDVEDTEDTSGSIPGSGRSPGEENCNLRPYSCLENPMDRGAWWAIVHEVTQSRTQIEATEHTCLTFLAFSVSSAVKNPPARKET